MTTPRLTDSAIARWADSNSANPLVRDLARDLRECREQRRALLAEVREATKMLKDLQKPKGA